MSVSAAAIKELRDKTGAGVMDCRAALTEADGDIEKAKAVLRKKGQLTAAKKAGRETQQGLVEAYIHPGGKFGALVEVNCETDFVARTDAFKQLARDLAMHITAANPLYIDSKSMPSGDVEAKRQQVRQDILTEGEPESDVDAMVEERMQTYVNEVCLLDQPWVKEPQKTIRQLIQETIQVTNENIQVRRFARFQLGE